MHRYENEANGAMTAGMEAGVASTNNHAMRAIASLEKLYTIKIMRKTNEGLDTPKMTWFINQLFKRKINYLVTLSGTSSNS